MNGSLVLLDTNIVLYILSNKYDMNKLPDSKFCVSFITEMELLSYPKLKDKEDKIIRKFLNSIDIIEMNEIIKEKAIQFRKKYHLKLPDAIICSTAYSEKAVLITNDTSLRKVKEIEVLK